MKRAWVVPSVVIALCSAAAGAQTEEEAPPRGTWANSTDFSLVVTRGNSDLQTLGLKETLEYKTAKGRSRLRLDALRSDTSDDPYYLIEAGLTFEPGETPTNFTKKTVRPDPEPDVSRFFAEGRYEGNLPKKATWNAGASWDRNDDAGILSRTIVFAGLGHVFKDRKDLEFRASYGLSYTDREEDIDDPEKDERFLGARFVLDFKDQWGAATTYDNDFTLNVSLDDVSDYNADLLQGVSVSMTEHLALKVSLQLTYASEPALESVDILLRALLIDPNGIPGDGDEFFQTVETGGVEIKVGEDVLRKEPLDATFRTSLQIKF
jgi:putative salt-induced outer membrane protein YdiY